jgi:hypothetical protein
MNFMQKLILAACLLISSMAMAQPAGELVIRRMLDRQTKAWNTGDLEGFMEGYWKSDSLMFIGKSGITYGWDATLRNYRKGYPDKAAMGTLTFGIISVQKLSSKYYQVVGKWHLARTMGDLEGHFTLLVKKISGNWVIVADHSS